MTVEEQIGLIWKEVLSLERVEADDNFFELGGHSLIAVQILIRLEEAFGVRPTLEDVFDAQTLGSLANRVRELM